MKKLLLFGAIALSIATFAQVPDYVPTNGLVGWWPFNGNANDESGNGNNGMVNGATLTTDRFSNGNSAYSFDGFSNYISVTNNPSLNFESNNSFTFGYWLKANSLSSTQLSLILSKQSGSATSQDGFNSNIESNRSSNFRIQNGTSTPSIAIGTSANSININTWIHVVQIWSGNIGKIYLNGILTVSNAGVALVGNNTSDLLIGKPNWVAGNVKNFHGNLDDIGIWNRALTECEITDLYNAQLNSFSVNAGIDQFVCEGGSVILSATGGTTYSWDNGVQNGVAFVAAGNQVYTVTSTSGSGCVATDQVNVTVNTLPSVNAGSDISVCDGNQVTLIGSGASNYSWDNGVSDGVPFTEQGTTTYTVTGTDGNNCSNTDQVTVTVNPLPFINAGPNQVICDGNLITLSASGGSNYSWDNGVSDGVPFTVQGTTTFTVTGTDGNNCSNTDQVTVTVNPLPAINGGLDQVVCEGDPVTLSGSGGDSYSWNNGISDGVSFIPTHLGDLTYTVTGTDANNCSNSDEVVVTVNEHTTGTQTETALDSYTWPVNNQTYTQSGTYTAVIPNAAGCDSTITLNLTLDFTGIGENGANLLAVYPNPTTSFLTIEGDWIQNKNYLLVDIQGRAVLNGTFKSNKETIDLKTITRGQYLLRLEGKEIKVVKE